MGTLVQLPFPSSFSFFPPVLPPPTSFPSAFFPPSFFRPSAFFPPSVTFFGNGIKVDPGLPGDVLDPMAPLLLVQPVDSEKEDADRVSSPDSRGRKSESDEPDAPVSASDGRDDEDEGVLSSGKGMGRRSSSLMVKKSSQSGPREKGCCKSILAGYADGDLREYDEGEGIWKTCMTI
jgi:hypothetical protein